MVLEDIRTCGNDASSQTTANASNLKKGTYKLIVKDIYGCSDSASYAVQEPTKVSLSVTATDSVNCYLGADGSINTSISGGSNGYTYQWDDASAQTTANASNLKKGTYKLIAKDIYGCSDSVTATIHEPAKVSITSSTIDSVNCYLGSDGFDCYHNRRWVLEDIRTCGTTLVHRQQQRLIT